MTDKPKHKNDSLLFPIRLFRHVWIGIFPLLLLIVAVVNQMWLQLANPEPNVIAYNYWSQARDVQERLLVVIGVTIIGMVGSLYLSRRYRLRNDNYINPNASRWSRSLLITLILAVAVGGNILAGAFINGNAHVIDTELYQNDFYRDDQLFVLTLDNEHRVSLYQCDVNGRMCSLMGEHVAQHRLYESMELRSYEDGIQIRIPHPNRPYLSLYIYSYFLPRQYNPSGPIGSD